MTNDVVQTFTANVLLAVGASPAMVIDPPRSGQFAAIADALLINVGTLTVDRAVAMRRGTQRQAGKPWALDPVAVGALTVRRRFVMSCWPCSRRPFAAMPLKFWRWPG
jgi:hydroxyethylthiazole kinase